MRKFLLFFVALMIISFLTPSIFLIGVRNNVVPKQDESSGDTKIKESKIENRDKIKLLLTSENKIIELDFDSYIIGVLIGEVPATYEIEALKAQALVARTYTLYKLKNSPNLHDGADMCDDINCCQCYKTKEYAFESWDDVEENEKWAKLEKAVKSTSNQVITYNGEIISAFFHANSGGKTENVKYVWGGKEIPYLQSVAGNEENPYQDTKTFTKEKFAEIIKSYVSDYKEKDYPIEIVDYTGSGRVNTLKIGEVQIKATELRKLTGIRSTNFRIEKNENGQITFYTIGYGHGVGMSQEGANSMAKSGSKYDEIIKHYYTGVEITIAN